MADGSRSLGSTEESNVLPAGLYERLIDGELKAILARMAHKAHVSKIDEAELSSVLTHHLQQRIREALDARKPEEKLAFANHILDTLVEDPVANPLTLAANNGLRIIDPSEGKKHLPEQLDAIISSVIDHSPRTDKSGKLPRTTGRSGDPDLLINAPTEPNLASQLVAEMKTADRVDLLGSFIKWTGIRVLQEGLEDLRDRHVPFRVLTTTYIGATERKALEKLAEYGAEIRINYDSSSTRLHAKAWSFTRNTGLNTAYVGSSNLSQVAMDSGVEWNVKLSASWAPHVIEKFEHAFEAYWSSGDYQKFDPNSRDDVTRLDDALRASKYGEKTVGSEDSLPTVGFLQIRPYPFQEEMLESLAAQRSHGFHKNLLVAATGTGKTVVAALDYARLDAAWPQPHGVAKGYPKLLFIAHRKEILNQARVTFRNVLTDHSFGELYVDGESPTKHNHVFASVQSLHKKLDQYSPEHFDVIIVDEFHHSSAATYRRILDYFRPKELLGMTATPERGDGEDVAVNFFDGRIAAELRLWDALEADLLVPFHYFGIADGTDLSRVTFERGAYDVPSLERVYLENNSRAALIIKELADKVVDVHVIKALGFCVSIKHAEYMAAVFNEAGIPAVAVSSNNDSRARAEGLRKLQDGEVNVLFAVDIFNEGVDIPQIDTILMLRPTQSATIFLQQLGRGLRRAHNKTLLTVLDFVGHQHAKFRFDMKLRAMTGLGRKKLIDGVEKGFAQLPPGTQVILDRVTRDEVLRNIKKSVTLNKNQLLQDIRDHGANSSTNLSDYLDVAGRNLEDIYGSERFTFDRQSYRSSWLTIRGLAIKNDVSDSLAEQDILGRLRAFLHVDDQERIKGYLDVLEGKNDGDFARMLYYMVDIGGHRDGMVETLERIRTSSVMREELKQILTYARSRAMPESQFLTGALSSLPFKNHAHYSQSEILAGFGGEAMDGLGLRSKGVFYFPHLNTDVFLATTNKTEKDYSPTTMYRDFSMTKTRFHWESQSGTSADDATGRRYLAKSSNVVLFVRTDRKGAFGANPFMCLGQVDYVRHQGSKPIQIEWELRRPMPTEFLMQTKLAS